MNTYEFIAAILTLLVTNIVTFAQQMKARKKDKEDMDKKQDEQIFNINEKLDHIMSYIEDTNFKNNLTDLLKIKSQQMIEANQDLDSDIISLLLYGRDLLSRFAKTIYFSNAIISEKFLINEVSTIMDRLKLFANEYFKEIKVFQAYDSISKKGVMVEGNFSSFLRNGAQIHNIMIGFIENVMVLKTDKFGEQSREKYIEYFVNFEQAIYLEAIAAYRKFNKLHSKDNN